MIRRSRRRAWRSAGADSYLAQRRRAERRRKILWFVFVGAVLAVVVFRLATAASA